jgi:8-oxo-dGTP pyrophosphatase MutT (NUDIX family)
MAQAFVFPGGGREGQEDLRSTAARELFEEAGVLLADREVPAASLAELRRRQAAGEPLDALLAEAGLRLELERLVPFSHWITPSAEKKRFSARFFAVELPRGQTPSFDNKETVDELWITPRDALARAHELILPPPQLRTLWELALPATRGPAAVLELARARGPRPPIVPRFVLLPDVPSGFALLAPWDADYESLGQGEGEPWPRELAEGPSRFVLEGMYWKHL